MYAVSMVLVEGVHDRPPLQCHEVRGAGSLADPCEAHYEHEMWHLNCKSDKSNGGKDRTLVVVLVKALVASKVSAVLRRLSFAIVLVNTRKRQFSSMLR
jgi:hypothetical protein